MKQASATTGAVLRSNPNKSASLLTMPPEIRNEIYRLVLLEDQVTVNDTSHTTPALLSTCRQLRKEASPIFQQENKFVLDVDSFQMGLTLHHWLRHGNPSAGFSFEFRGKMNWSNLKLWLQKYHKHEAYSGFLIHDEADTRVKCVSHAFKIVDEMNGMA